MKTTFYISVLTASLMLAGCSHKVVDPETQKLKDRQILLEKTTGLNDLKVKIQETQLEYNSLKEKTAEINDQASKSAADARTASDQVTGDPGNTGLAGKANNTAKKAAKDAHLAKTLNKELSKTSDKLTDLQKKADKMREELSKLERKIEFVPRQQAN